MDYEYRYAFIACHCSRACIDLYKAEAINFFMKAINVRNGNSLSTNVAVAHRLFDRMKGLLGKHRLERGESLLITPCRSIHTLGMKFPIDVIFLDNHNRVIALNRNLLPNRISYHHFTAAGVLELPAGTLASTDTNIGDTIQFD